MISRGVIYFNPTWKARLTQSVIGVVPYLLFQATVVVIELVSSDFFLKFTSWG